MNFTLSTKPLAAALDLGVIQANVSKYYQKSCLAQLTATKHELKINLEAAQICSELILKGSGDVDETCVVFVDCLVLKQLVNTFETGVITIEYVDGGIVLHSGKSKFTLPSIIEAGELELTRPQLGEYGAASEIDQTGWKFIKDYQMYAISMSFAHPVYTKVWVGEDGNVIVGDFDNSIFTLSGKADLGETCLLPDTIINLFNNLPQGAQITKLANSYRIDVKTDAYQYVSEFKPLHETDEGMSEYHADAILGMAAADSESSFVLPVPAVSKALNQITLLASGTDKTVKIALQSNEFTLTDKNVDFKLTVEGTCPDFSGEFSTDLIKSILSNMDAENVRITPMISEGVTQGITVWTENLSAVLGALEE